MSVTNPSASDTADDVEVKSEITEVDVENLKPEVECKTIHFLDNISKKQLNPFKFETQLKKKHTPTKSNNSNHTEDRMRELYKSMKSVDNSHQERENKIVDDFDVFGDIVARKLRRFRTRCAQITVQHLINNILYEAEMGRYDEPINIPANNYLDSSMVSKPSCLHLNSSSFDAMPESTTRDVSNYCDGCPSLSASASSISQLNHSNIRIKPEPSQ